MKWMLLSSHIELRHCQFEWRYFTSLSSQNPILRLICNRNGIFSFPSRFSERKWEQRQTSHTRNITANIVISMMRNLIEKILFLSTYSIKEVACFRGTSLCMNFFPEMLERSSFVLLRTISFGTEWTRSILCLLNNKSIDLFQKYQVRERLFQEIFIEN